MNAAHAKIFMLAGEGMNAFDRMTHGNNSLMTAVNIP